MHYLFHKFLMIVGVGVAAGAAIFASPGILTAHAADLTVSPAVIDASGVPNDILNYTLAVTNLTGNQLNVFASVYELTPSGTQTFADPSASDRPALLADWISVSRGSMTFKPGETKTIPVSITINPYATAGDYHAVIGFVEGGTRYDAEQHLDGAPQALINMSVASNLTASLRIDGFAAAKNFYSSFPVTFNYTIENNGDVPSTPSGQVMFYDRQGHEIGSVDANPAGDGIAPGQKKSFTADWTGGGSFGQYKAILDLSYGPTDDKIQNTALVWVLPWQKIVIAFGALFALMIIFTIWLHREYEKRHHRRRQLIEALIQRKGITERKDTERKNMDEVIDLRRHHRHD